MTSWRSYPNIYALGHRAVKDIFSVPTRGVPEWYKNELLKKQFETETETKPDTYCEVDWN